MKSDEEFLTGIYRKAEQRRKEEAEGKLPAVKSYVRRKGPNRIAVIGMLAACFCVLLAFSIYGKRLKGDALNPENLNPGIQTLDLGEDTENPVAAVGPQRMRIVEEPVLLLGTVQSYTEGIGDAMAVLCLQTEELDQLEIYVTYKESFIQGEEVALLLTIEEDMYYLKDSGQKYDKGEDGLYYNTFGEVLLEGE